MFPRTAGHYLNKLVAPHPEPHHIGICIAGVGACSLVEAPDAMVSPQFLAIRGVMR